MKSRLGILLPLAQGHCKIDWAGGWKNIKVVRDVLQLEKVNAVFRIHLKTVWMDWKTIIKEYKALVATVNYGKHSSWLGHSINICWVNEVNKYKSEMWPELKWERVLETFRKTNTQWDHQQRTKKLIQIFSSRQNRKIKIITNVADFARSWGGMNYP